MALGVYLVVDADVSGVCLVAGGLPVGVSVSEFDLVSYDISPGWQKLTF
jgi:hypothetical protein